MKKEIKILYIISLVVFTVLMVLGFYFILGSYNLGINWSSMYDISGLYKIGVSIYILIGGLLIFFAFCGYLINYIFYLKIRHKGK